MVRGRAGALIPGVGLGIPGLNLGLGYECGAGIPGRAGVLIPDVGLGVRGRAGTLIPGVGWEFGEAPGPRSRVWGGSSGQGRGLGPGGEVRGRVQVWVQGLGMG